MKQFLALIFLAVFASSADAAIKPYFQDIKLNTQAVLEHQQVKGPVAASNTRILNANAGDTTGVGATVTSFSAQPDVPRNLTILPGDQTSAAYNGVKAGTVTVTGTDFFGKALTENFTIGINQSTAVVGNKAFKTVTSIAIPAENSPFAVAWSVGVGSKLGFKNCLERAGDIGWAELNGVRESTMPTVASTQAAVSGNTFQLNSALNSTDVDVYFTQNFRCL